MLGLNNVQIIGNLGGTPDVKFLNDGKSQVVNFSVAVNERWKNRDGEPQERTTWLRVAAFNGIGQACAEYLVCGDGVYVEGRLQVREYEDKDSTRVRPLRWSRPRSVSWAAETTTARRSGRFPGNQRLRGHSRRLRRTTSIRAGMILRSRVRKSGP